MSNIALVTDYEISRPSGYGKILSNIGRELSKNHNVYMYGFESGAAADHNEPFPIIPTAPNQIISQMRAVQSETDYVIFACDLTLHAHLASLVDIKYVGIFVIEGDDIMFPTILATTIQLIDYPFVLTKHGKRICDKFNLNSYYLPVGVGKEFHPDAQNRYDSRKQMGFEQDDIIILTIADNQERKNYPLNIKAFSIFNQKYPNSYYLIISRPRPEFIGWDLRALTREYNVADKVIIYDQGIPEDRLIKFYQLSDAFLLLSASEGFGVPLLEAQASGVPCVVTDNSGMKEQIEGGGGYLVRLDYEYIHPLGNSTRHFADPKDAANGLKEVAFNKTFREECVEKGLRRAKECTWERSSKELEKVFEQEVRQEEESITSKVSKFITA